MRDQHTAVWCFTGKKFCGDMVSVATGNRQTDLDRSTVTEPVVWGIQGFGNLNDAFIYVPSFFDCACTVGVQAQSTSAATMAREEKDLRPDEYEANC